MTNNQNLLETSDDKHVMLLYEKDEARTDVAVHLINQGLENGRFCVYASVHALDERSSSNFSSLCSKITDYRKNIDSGSLHVVDFKPHFESAQRGDLTLFEQLKANLEQTLRQRISEGKGDKIMVFADVACCLSENKRLNESETLESWWQDAHNEWMSKNHHITVICPHPNCIFERETLSAKAKISYSHDLTINLNDFVLETSHTPTKEINEKRILIVESEPDLRHLYSEYFKYLGFDVVVAEDGNKCMSVCKEKDFDVIILDTHLRGSISVVDVAKQIRHTTPNQRIVLTTTHSLDQITNVIDSLGVNREDVLVKPFMFSRLLGVIKPASGIS